MTAADSAKLLLDLTKEHKRLRAAAHDLLHASHWMLVAAKRDPDADLLRMAARCMMVALEVKSLSTVPVSEGLGANMDELALCRSLMKEAVEAWDDPNSSSVRRRGENIQAMRAALRGMEESK